MTRPILYYYETNAQSRFVMMVAKEIGLDMDYRQINIIKREQYKPEFTKISPMHQIPTLDDNGFFVYDGHAICTYLVTKYGKNDKLYPRDLVMRTEVDQILHFDCGFMFAKLRRLVTKVFYNGFYEIPQYTRDEFEKCYEYLETMFRNNTYLVGNHMTLADLTCFATISNMITIVPMVTKYNKLNNWYKMMTQLPYYKELNLHGSQEFKKYFFDFIEKNKKM